MRPVVVAVLLLTVACSANPKPARVSSTPTASPGLRASASPTPSPIASASPVASAKPASSRVLFAALEAHSTAAARPDTVVIGGLDGLARAQTTFTPISPPPIGCYGTALPTSAYVAAGEVFFADGSGVIRSLSVQGRVRTIATFQTSSQQMLSFAVSPDGSQLLATVLTVPQMTSSGAACTGSQQIYSGDFTLEVFSAPAGGNSKSLYHENLPIGPSKQYPCTLELAGWDRVGPYGTHPACLGPAGGAGHYFGGPVVRVNAATGQVLNQAADPTSCLVQDIAFSGDFVCIPPGIGADVIVRRRDGSEIWRFVAQPNDGYNYAFLSPDERHVLAQGSGAEVLGSEGTDVKVVESQGDHVSFFGWLDASAVIGEGPNGNLSYVSLDSPATLVDLGFHGLFIATVPA